MKTMLVIVAALVLGLLVYGQTTQITTEMAGNANLTRGEGYKPIVHKLVVKTRFEDHGRITRPIYSGSIVIDGQLFGTIEGEY